MEYIAKTIQAYPQTCVGCQRFKRDVMIAFQADSPDLSADPDKIHDLFLTKEQAEDLVAKLQDVLARNGGDEDAIERYNRDVEAHNARVDRAPPVRGGTDLLVIALSLGAIVACLIKFFVLR